MQPFSLLYDAFGLQLKPIALLSEEKKKCFVAEFGLQIYTESGTT